MKNAEMLDSAAPRSLYVDGGCLPRLGPLHSLSLISRRVEPWVKARRMVSCAVAYREHLVASGAAARRLWMPTLGLATCPQTLLCHPGESGRSLSQDRSIIQYNSVNFLRASQDLDGP